jgi:hypothetical protein
MLLSLAIQLHSCILAPDDIAPINMYSSENNPLTRYVTSPDRTLIGSVYDYSTHCKAATMI